MRRFLYRFIDLEADPDGLGDPGGDPGGGEGFVDPGAVGDLGPADPTAPAEPQYLTAADVDRIVAERMAQADPYQGYPPQYVDPGYDPQWGQQQQTAPVLDPLADDFGQNLAETIRGIIREETAPTLGPIADAYQNQQAQQWAAQAFQSLQVPEDDRWRQAALAASAGFERDQWGQPVHPQYALQQGYSLLRELVQAERDAAIKEYQTQQTETQQQQQARLQAVADAPQTPAGVGGVEGEPEPTSVRAAFRAAMERVTAA